VGVAGGTTVGLGVAVGETSAGIGAFVVVTGSSDGGLGQVGSIGRAVGGIAATGLPWRQADILSRSRHKRSQERGTAMRFLILVLYHSFLESHSIPLPGSVNNLPGTLLDRTCVLFYIWAYLTRIYD
jgi:hypothetical protein